MIDNVKNYFKQFGMEDKVLVFDTSTATIELAAQTIGCETRDIAKSLSFYNKEGGCIMVITDGDKKISKKKYKATFGQKAKMLSFDDVPLLTGHEVGGVCPFAVGQDVKVYLDESLKSHDFVYPACGSHNSAIKLSIPELEKYADHFESWVDVTD